MNDPKTALIRFVEYWEALTPESVHQITTHYTEDATFGDPFNEVRGHLAIQHIFNEMFVRLHAPRFRVTETVAEPHGAFLVWEFSFRVRAFKPHVLRSIHGTTHIRLADDGRVIYHRDYWDAATELYETFPVIGPVMRILRRRFA